ncbi:type III secretion system stalk subunit SctO [Aestuariispira insulae]|uniref:Type III secretion system (T3SS) protein YscO n=1 Tax=Aestuariispira insulae TaxID=1461337 RepID=A0A3D9H2L8_9PROT|nr:YscO family type III secretion system apparatus protein [Aestuariispira insulae]RED43734.1 type III secretion system (T3SS) protein YscO [Aestuariispira insulae]
MKNVMTVLEGLHSRREKRLLKDLQNVVALLEQARAAQAEADQALQRFGVEREQRIQALTAGLLGHEVGLKEVEWFRFQWEEIQNEGLRRKAAAQEAAERVLQAKERVEEARQAHHAASRKRTKIQEISLEISKELKSQACQAAERQEEEALESLISLKGGA